PVTPTGKRVTANKPSGYPFLHKKERDRYGTVPHQSRAAEVAKKFF
ncbi:TPA_asm: hypothetical protein, partial [Porphyromonas phage phage024a_F0570]